MKEKPEISFEFFPPKTDRGVENLNKVRDELGKLKPKYFSVTFGAGGSTQEGTFEAVKGIINAGYQGAPHVSCVGSSADSVKSMLDQYIEIGVKRIVALRGDLPSGMVERGDFKYANELVAFVRETYGQQFHVEVAAYPEFHPESRSAVSEFENFKRKVDAGADSAITQYFFNSDAYFSFVETAEAHDISVPIIPGIMPITNFAQLARFSDICGAEIPRWLRKRLEEYQDDEESLLSFGLDYMTFLCETLLSNGVHGLHFYALNRAHPSIEICKRLQLGG
ncbi:MAG: methylenetetrahydrofolate reductase [NAD(P)H] [Arenicella sp.]